MSISDKITSIENHLSSDYEGLENIGADLTGINKNILNIRTILDTIYNDMPKVTGEGTEVTLTPTRKGRLALIPKGNSTQESTNGYQLIDLSTLEGSSIVVRRAEDKEELINVLAITVRYFGGIKLGAGGLVRAYSKSVRDAILRCNEVEVVKGVKVKITISYDMQKNLDYALRDYNIVNKVYDGVKVLGNLKPEETFNKKYTVKATKFSKAAKEAIEAAGGTVEVI